MEPSTALVRVGPAYITTMASRRGPAEAHDFPDPSDPRLVALTEPDSPRAESFRILRDRLLARKLPRLLAVTSPGRTEGKTTCAVGLAAALAERSMTTVLLLDGNLLEPAFARLFGLDEAAPTSSGGHAPWLTAYKIVELSHSLCVAAPVRAAGQPRPRLDPRWFDVVLGHLAGGPFDHVIVDLPALECTPAVAQIVGAADATLLAVKAGVTRASALRNAVKEIGEGRALGVAVMDAAR